MLMLISMVKMGRINCVMCRMGSNSVSMHDIVVSLLVSWYGMRVNDMRS